MCFPTEVVIKLFGIIVKNLVTIGLTDFYVCQKIGTCFYTIDYFILLNHATTFSKYLDY